MINLSIFLSIYHLSTNLYIYLFSYLSIFFLIYLSINQFDDVSICLTWARLTRARCVPTIAWRREQGLSCTGQGQSRVRTMSATSREQRGGTGSLYDLAGGSCRQKHSVLFSQFCVLDRLIHWKRYKLSFFLMRWKKFIF